MPNQPKTQGRTVRVDDETWEAVKAEAERRGVTTSEVVRIALRNMLGTLPLLVALLALMVWGNQVPATARHRTCHASWCADRVGWERAQVGEIINRQLAARPDCTATPRLTR